MTVVDAIQAMSPVDRAWLEMDDPHNPMVISAVLELIEVHDVEAVARRVLAGLLGHRRFVQCVDDGREPPVWRDGGELQLPYHLRIYHLTEDCPQHDLRHAVARELGRMLDRALPMWQMTFFVRDGGRVTVLFRAHHALADGIALVRVLMSCTDDAANGRTVAPSTAAVDARRHGPLVKLIDRLESANERLEGLARLVRAELRDPARLMEQLRSGRQLVSAMGRVLALPDDNPRVLRRRLSGHRAVAWTHRLAFAPIKRRARQLKVKINDIFLTALAGAMGRFLRETEGGVDPQQNLRISIPVNLRAQDDHDLGNCFGLVLLDLPVGVAAWRKRLQIISQRMQALKDSPEARAVLLSLNAAGHMPVPIEKRLVGLLTGKSVAVVSNLPGPETALRFAGTRLDNLVFWPPQAGSIGLGISLFSYAGRLSVGVSADTALMRCPERLIAAFEDEIERMLHPRQRRGASGNGAAAADDERHDVDVVPACNNRSHDLSIERSDPPCPASAPTASPSNTKPSARLETRRSF